MHVTCLVQYLNVWSHKLCHAMEPPNSKNSVLAHGIVQREIGNLGVTVEARSLNEEKGSKGKMGRKHGQNPIKSNVANRGAQKLEEKVSAKENCVSDKEGPKEQKKRRKVVATREET